VGRTWYESQSLQSPLLIRFPSNPSLNGLCRVQRTYLTTTKSRIPHGPGAVPVEIPYLPGDCIYHPKLSEAVDLHLTVKERPSLPNDRNKIILRWEDKE
jgi:hypothetical protein